MSYVIEPKKEKKWPLTGWAAYEAGTVDTVANEVVTLVLEGIGEDRLFVCGIKQCVARSKSWQ
jgi:hypothetical protein